MAEAKKAPDDGIYTWNGRQYRAKAGTLMPPGAEFRALKESDRTAAETAKAEQRRARQAAAAEPAASTDASAKAIKDLTAKNKALEQSLADLSAKVEALTTAPPAAGKGPNETTKGAGPSETS
jgi:hypothetical protein